MHADVSAVVKVPLENQNVEVELVTPRGDGSRLVISESNSDSVSPDDLVALAQQLVSARELVKGRAFDRLRTIAEQMEQLRRAAIHVLEEAKRDEELHSVACNMQKYPGQKTEEYVASYRLESDRSWTPIADIVERDQQFASLKTFMKQQIL
ncbi:unnamed protein product [Angiostrongylus costaricensis]|uniref:DUF4140 domain-containing protein n=1 Tax=Angiostrongylus costaricensis TaxID=334426 RepID=A0A0R3PD81_ANGCS|nr:unnamed protein product [Angiostrongylus costaricensis]